MPEAEPYLAQLAQYKPLFIEEPTSPDDILGHAKIREQIRKYNIKVATGEHCQNRIMFKQFMQAKALDFVQVDACRLGGLSEVLAVLLLAAKFEIPIHPVHSSRNFQTHSLTVFSLAHRRCQPSRIQSTRCYHRLPSRLWQQNRPRIHRRVA